MRPGGYLPSVSVCLPVREGSSHLAETLRSVLDQTWRDVEVVVADGSGVDHGTEVASALRDERVRVERVRGGRGGQPPDRTDVWNRAVELCRAPLVKLVVAGELLHPRCLELQAPPMRDDPEIALVAGRRHLVDELSRVLVPRRGLAGGLVGAHTGADVARQVVRVGGNPVGPAVAVLFRREQFVTAGGWRPDRPHVVDLDCWLRLLPHGGFLGLPETLAAVRARDGVGTAEQERARRQEQRGLVAEIEASGAFEIGDLDARIGRLTAPLRWVRRSALLGLTRVKDQRVPADA